MLFNEGYTRATLHTSMIICTCNLDSTLALCKCISMNVSMKTDTIKSDGYDCQADLLSTY